MSPFFNEQPVFVELLRVARAKVKSQKYNVRLRY